MIDGRITHSMSVELEKLAFLGAAVNGIRAATPAVGSYLRASAGNIGAGMGVGSGVGAAVGAGVGGYRGYKQDKAEGGSGLAGGVMGGLKGGASGAAVGALAGGALGLASGGAGSAAVQKATSGKYNPLRMMAESGQRNLHSVTGLAPNGARFGTPEYVESLAGINVGGIRKNLQRIEQGHRKGNVGLLAQQVANLEQGKTSIMGVAKNLKDTGVVRGLKDVANVGIVQPWQASGLKGKAMMAGVPLAMAGGAAYLGGRPEEEGGQAHYAEKFLGSLGSGGAGMLTPGVSDKGGNLISRAGGAAGATVGKGIDKLVGAIRRKPTGPASSYGGGGNGYGSSTVDRVYSNAALGRPPEDLQA